jgi:hypothetical protein
MHSDLSRLGGFARATVSELSRAGFKFAGVDNGIVRLTPPAGGEPLEFTNDAYLSPHVAAPVRDDASNDDADFSASLGGADFSPVYDSTTAADAPAVNAPDWDPDAEIIAALEQYHAPAELPELGFDRDTAAGIADAATAAGLSIEDLERIADRCLSHLDPNADRMPREVIATIDARVTRLRGARIAEARMAALRGDRVLKTRSVCHKVAPTVRVEIAEAAIVAEALRSLRAPSDVYVLSTFDLSPEARPVIRGKRSVWDALDDAEKGHNVTWHCRRKDRN